jgi:poly(3-hydroxybutyrate) depolymerase
MPASIRLLGSRACSRLPWCWCRVAGGAEVQLWRLTGAGHGWPGGHVRLPEKVMGSESATIDAALEVWRFVSRFRRPDAPALKAR